MSTAFTEDRADAALVRQLQDGATLSQAARVGRELSSAYGGRGRPAVPTDAAPHTPDHLVELQNRADAQRGLAHAGDKPMGERAVVNSAAHEGEHLGNSSCPLWQLEEVNEWKWRREQAVIRREKMEAQDRERCDATARAYLVRASTEYQNRRK